MKWLTAVSVAMLLSAGMAFLPLNTAAAVETPTSQLLTRDIVVEAGGTYLETLHVEISVRNASAARQASRQAVAYQELIEDLDVVEAYTLKADGSRIPVAPGAISVQAAQGTQNLSIDDRKQKLIVFPKVAAGDRVVYTTRRHVREPIFPGYFSVSDYVSRTVSYDDVRETIVAPKTMPLTVETHGMTFTKEEGDATTTYRWTYHAPDALVEDNAQLSPYDVNPRFFASSFKDYDELARVYAAITDPMTAATPTIQAQADLITAGISDRREQAKTIYDWVSTHIRYVGLELGRGGWVPRTAESILANGYGDCKDHALVFAALLKARGIDSQIVLINLGDGYSLPSAPPGQFNHAINWLPEFGLYADTTQEVASFGVLASEEYGKPVVHAVATGDVVRHTPVIPAGATSISVKTSSKLDSTGKLTGETKTIASGSAALDLRSYGLGILASGAESKAAARLQGLGYLGGSGTFELASPHDLDSPDYSIVGRFDVPPQPQYLSGVAFQMFGGLRVFGATGDWLMGPLWNYKLTGADTTACYSGHAEEELSLELPAGKHLVKLPSDIRIADKHVEFTAHWSMHGHTVAVKRDFKVTVDQALCAGDLRKEAARALAAIRDSYNLAQLSLADDAGM
jgi:transglutaminase-like putative cysteine protease